MPRPVLHVCCLAAGSGPDSSRLTQICCLALPDVQQSLHGSVQVHDCLKNSQLVLGFCLPCSGQCMQTQWTMLLT